MILAAALRPWPSDLMEAHEVSTLVIHLRMIWRRAFSLFHPSSQLNASCRSCSERAHRNTAAFMTWKVRRSVREWIEGEYSSILALLDHFIRSRHHVRRNGQTNLP